jgi:hypothetical protein
MDADFKNNMLSIHSRSQRARTAYSGSTIVALGANVRFHAVTMSIADVRESSDDLQQARVCRVLLICEQLFTNHLISYCCCTRTRC